MPQTDIIARIREGDRDAFNAFCRERYASLIAFARLFLSRINGTWADDVVQDVLFGLWQNRASLYDDGSSLQAYLLRSVYHRCLNYLKKERRSEALDADDESKMVSRMAEYYDPQQARFTNKEMLKIAIEHDQEMMNAIRQILEEE